MRKCARGKWYKNQSRGKQVFSRTSKPTHLQGRKKWVPNKKRGWKRWGKDSQTKRKSISSIYSLLYSSSSSPENWFRVSRKTEHNKETSSGERDDTKASKSSRERLPAEWKGSEEQNSKESEATYEQDMYESHRNYRVTNINHNSYKKDFLSSSFISSGIDGSPTFVNIQCIFREIK